MNTCSHVLRKGPFRNAGRSLSDQWLGSCKRPARMSVSRWGVANSCPSTNHQFSPFPSAIGGMVERSVGNRRKYGLSEAVLNP